MSNEVEVSQVLAQMRAMAAKAGGGEGADAGAASQASSDFSSLLKQSVEQVNELQKESGQLQEAFEKGDPDVNLAQVMVAVQKADVSFKAMTEVRNKLLEAYKEIMRMQV